MKENQFEFGAAPKPKKRGLFCVALVLLAAVAGAGAWAGYEYMRKGEVVLPLPEELAGRLIDIFDLGPDGKIGPLRLGEAGQSAALQGGPDGLPPGGSIPAGRPSANTLSGQISGSSGVTVPAGSRVPGQGESGQASPQAPQSADGRSYIAPPAGSGAPDASGGEQFGTMLEGGSFQPDTFDGVDGSAPGGRFAADESGMEEAYALGYGGNGLTLPQPGDATSASALAPTSLPGAAAGESGRVKIYSGEDAAVPLNFVTDLAVYLANSYQPADSRTASRATSRAGLKDLNQRYGIDLKGFAGGNSATRDYYRDRRLILNYAFTPSLVQALTNLYVDRFADNLAQAGLNRGDLNQAQTAAMLEYYAADCRALGAAFMLYAETPDASLRVAEYTRAQQETYAANARHLDAKVAVEMARESGEAASIQEAGKDVSRLEKVYAECRRREKSAEDRVLRIMSRASTRRLDAASLVYAAGWLGRRGSGNEQTIRAAAASLAFTAEVLNEKAAELLAQ
ncbi:MAG: hypothetical protein LBV80_02220 [Deltaproteobacteria bacterium]|jgi:hypothetical protein|nr:hypothetical protein [Deltaproteobacteria bacterium]